MTTHDLAELKSYLESELAALQNHEFDMSADVCPDLNDMASLVCDTQIKAAVNARASAAIRELQEALRRVRHASYGYCDECGEPIGLARLKARPSATMCVDCQLALEKAL